MSVSTLVVQHIWQLPRSFLQSYEVIIVILGTSCCVINHAKQLYLCSIGFEWCPQRNTFTAFCLYAQIFHSLPDADLLVLVCWNTSVYQILWCMFLITFKYINWCIKRDIRFAWYHVSRYWLKTKDNKHALNSRTYLNEVLFYHSSYMFSQYWSLHHKTIEYIPVELLNSNHRQFVSPNNSFSERVVFIHLHHVFNTLHRNGYISRNVPLYWMLS